MRLSTAERAVRDECLAEAHAAGGSTREIAARFVSLIEDLERFGHPWVTAYLHHLRLVGAMSVCRQYRRRFTLPLTTEGGEVIQVPAFVGPKALEAMTPAELAADIARMEATRDTVSVEIAAKRKLLRRAKRSGASTVGDALRGRAA